MKTSENFFYASSSIAGIHFKVFSTHKGIRALFINQKDALLDGNSIKVHREDPLMHGIFKQLSEYLYGTRKSFDVPLDIKGTDFQVKVWNELLKVPYGKLISYKQLAINANSEKAVRAVGSAMGANHIPIIIPCHRVIQHNGKLGGFALGPHMKEKFLEIEGSLSLELFDS